jgi:uncharacterized membrane protein YdbT with pleckstrin-like domain
MVINFTYNWSKIFAPEETMQKEFGVSSLYLNALLACALLVGIAICFVSVYAGILLFVLLVLFWFYMKKAKHYAFTNKRLILVDALIGENVVSVDYNQITDITLEQSVIGQIGKWGTIIINTAGNNAPSYTLSFIHNPQEIKQALDAIRDTLNPPMQ